MWLINVDTVKGMFEGDVGCIQMTIVYFEKWLQ